METRQRDHIKKNLTALMGLITVNTKLLAIFEEKGVLSKSDLESIKSKKTPSEQVYHLLELLETRKDAFATLVEALQTVNQTGAVVLLSQLNRPISTCTPYFVNVPNELCKFVSDTQMTKRGILLSNSITESCTRIRDYWPTMKITHEWNDFSNCIKARCKRAIDCIIDKKMNWIHLAFKDKCLIILPEEFNLIINGYTVITDTLWNSLSKEWQDEICNRCIRFQGRKHQLSSFIDQLCQLKGIDRSHILEKLETNFLLELMNNTEPEVAGGNLPNMEDKYIHRTLVSRRRISKKIVGVAKDSKFDDILVFRGEDLQLYHLTTLVEAYGEGTPDTSTAQIKRPEITVNCILLDCEGDFEDLSEKCGNRSIHLLECRRENGTEIAKDFMLFWIKTKGSFRIIQNFVHKFQDTFPETHFYDSAMQSQLNETNQICITDSPGMGKSYLLANCGKELIKSTSNDIHQVCHVHYFTMSNFVNIYVNLQSEDENNGKMNMREGDLLTTLQRSCSNYYIGREFVRSVFQTDNTVAKELALSKIKFHLMFDGFDEVADELVDDSNYVIEYFCRTQFKVSVTIWVATRPQRLDQTEEIMNVLGYTIQNFNKEDQVALLTNCWGEDCEMQVLARECIEKFHKRLQTNDQKDIIGFPLLCGLLAKTYKKEAVKKNGQTYLLRKINDLTIDKLYNTYVLKRFEKNKKDKEGEESDNPALLRHFELALSTIFPNMQEVNNLFTHNLHFTNYELLSWGILEYGCANQTNPFRFVHTTIAEYLVAQSILHILRHAYRASETSESRLKTYLSLVRRVFSVYPSHSELSNVGFHKYVVPNLQFQFPNICIFLNFALFNQFNYSDEKQTASAPIIFDELLMVYKADVKDNIKLAKMAWNRLVAATKANHYHIAYPLIKALRVLLSRQGWMENFFRELPEYELPVLVYLASRFSSLELAEKIYDLANLIYKDKAISNFCVVELPFSDIVKYNQNCSHNQDPYEWVPDNFCKNCVPYPDLQNVLPLLREKLKATLVKYKLRKASESDKEFSFEDIASSRTSPRPPRSPPSANINDLNCSQNESSKISNVTSKPSFLNNFDACFVSSDNPNDCVIHFTDLSCMYFSCSEINTEFSKCEFLLLDKLSRVLTPLHCAVEAGNHKLTKYLLDRYFKNAKSLDFKFRYLLQFCLLNSINDVPVLVTKKENILRLLKEKYPCLLDDNPYCVGICLEKMHLRLLLSYIKIKHELNSGWDLLLTNNYGENLLHLLAAGHYDNDMTPEKYHDVLLKLKKIGFNVGRCLIEFNHLSWTALDIAVASMDLLDETFDFFDQIGIKFDYVDFRGSSILYKAISGQRGVGTFRKLIFRGASFAPKFLDETILHVSVLFSNIEAVKFFVTEALHLNLEQNYCQFISSSDLDSDGYYYKHLIRHLELFKCQLDDLYGNLTNNDTEFRHHFEQIMYNLDNLPYNYEKIRKKLAVFAFRKVISYQSDKDYMKLNKLYNDLRDVLDNDPVNYILKEDNIQQNNYVDNSHITTETTLPNFPGDTYIRVNLQDSNGNTPLHMCFRYKYEMELLEFKATQHEDISLENVEEPDYTKRYRTSIPVKRRFLGSKSSIFYEKSSPISRNQHIDVEPDNQPQTISFLIENGANIAIPNDSSITPMDLALYLCLDGLTDKNEKAKLEGSYKNLFSDNEGQANMTLALKGLLLNINFGYAYNPSLIKSFANAIRDHGGDVLQKNVGDGASLLHLAAKGHSYYGLKYLIECNAICVNTVDNSNQNALDYMTCSRSKNDCDKMNCKKIRDYLSEKINI